MHPLLLHSRGVSLDHHRRGLDGRGRLDPGASPSSSTESRVIAAVTMNGPAWISTSAITPSTSTERTTPAKRLRAEPRVPVRCRCGATGQALHLRLRGRGGGCARRGGCAACPPGPSGAACPRSRRSPPQRRLARGLWASAWALPMQHTTTVFPLSSSGYGPNQSNEKSHRRLAGAAPAAEQRLVGARGSGEVAPHGEARQPRRRSG